MSMNDPKRPTGFRGSGNSRTGGATAAVVAAPVMATVWSNRQHTVTTSNPPATTGLALDGKALPVTPTAPTPAQGAPGGALFLRVSRPLPRRWAAARNIVEEYNNRLP